MSLKQPLGQVAVNYGKQFLGTKYAWGGSSPGGFDCSGFVSYVYRKNGVSLPRTSAMQYAYLKNKGKLINENQLQPGDLIFFGKGKVTDVKMYAGNGQLIGARGGPYTPGSVVIAPLHYRKDLIGYGAVSRNINRAGSSPVAMQPQQQQKQVKDPNTLGTNKILEEAQKRQYIMSRIRQPQYTPIIQENAFNAPLKDMPDFLIQGVI